MNIDIKEVSTRLKATREAREFTTAYMAEKTGLTTEQYAEYENGAGEFSLSFLNECAIILGIELVELLTGSEPRLQKYSMVKNNKGLPITRREGFSYQHVAYLFKNKKIEPLIVTAPYSDAEQDKPIRLSCHEGQEMDYIISGKLKITIDSHTEILEPGDSIYYDSKNPHGMIAVGGEECKFLAILI